MINPMPELRSKKAPHPPRWFSGYFEDGPNLDAYAARRPVETPVVVFEPRSSRRADGSASGLTRRAEDGPGAEDPVEGVRPAVPAASFEAGAFTAGTVKRT